MSECSHIWKKSRRLEGGGRCAYDEGKYVDCFRCEKCNKTISVDEYKNSTNYRLEAERAQKQLVIDDCKRNLQEQDAAIARLTQELEEARRWVNDLQSGMYINCVYCGHRYGPKDKVPCTMADALKQHIEQCPKHPMSSLRAELADLKDGLTAAHMDGFASGKAEATEMLRKRDGQLEELRAKLEQAEKDASIIRKIREIRNGMPVGTPCGCEFDENDECLKRCALHDEVYKTLEAAEGKVDAIMKALNGEHLTLEAIHKLEEILK